MFLDWGDGGPFRRAPARMSALDDPGCRRRCSNGRASYCGTSAMYPRTRPHAKTPGPETMPDVYTSVSQIEASCGKLVACGARPSGGI